jgi:spore coat protein U-like protein
MLNFLRPIIRRRELKLTIAVLFLLPSATRSDAATATSTFTLPMTVTSSCALKPTPTHHLGTSRAHPTVPAPPRGAVHEHHPYNIGLDAGLGTGATVAVRKLTNGSNTINYSLTPPARTTVGQHRRHESVAGTGNGASQNYTVRPRAGADDPTPAAYTDTITVTVTG